MEIKAVFAILFVTSLLVQDSHGWLGPMKICWRCIRDRRPARISCRWSCPRTCRYVPSLCRFVCSISCRYICGTTKREANEGHVTPLSTNFDFYDLDDNELVSRMEFTSTLGALVTDEDDLVKAFNITDTDEDGMLTEQELFQSPCLVFDDPPADETKQQ